MRETTETTETDRSEAQIHRDILQAATQMKKFRGLGVPLLAKEWEVTLDGLWPELRAAKAGRGIFSAQAQRVYGPIWMKLPNERRITLRPSDEAIPKWL